MKKLTYFILFALALVACTPDRVVNNVRISVSIEDKQQAFKGQQRISAVDNGDVIDVKWEKGDVLYYDKSDKTKVFQVVKIENDGKNAILECKDFTGNPNNFNLYYYGSDDVDFENPMESKQIVIVEKGSYVINNDYLKYTATNCKIGSGITLQPNFAILGVEVYGDYNEVHNYTMRIGSNYGGNSDYLSIISEQVIGKNPIYYIVFPYENESIYSFGDKYLWLSHSTDGQQINSASNEISFNNNRPIELTPGEAQIIRIKVEKTNNSVGALVYNISPYQN